jgi:hypothetical protein
MRVAQSPSHSTQRIRVIKLFAADWKTAPDRDNFGSTGVVL